MESGNLQLYKRKSFFDSYFLWLRNVDCIALFLFVVGSVCLSGAGQQQALGILLIISSLALCWLSLRKLTIRLLSLIHI